MKIIFFDCRELEMRKFIFPKSFAIRTTPHTSVGVELKTVMSALTTFAISVISLNITIVTLIDDMSSLPMLSSKTNNKQ